MTDEILTDYIGALQRLEDILAASYLQVHPYTAEANVRGLIRDAVERAKVNLPGFELLSPLMVASAFGIIPNWKNCCLDWILELLMLSALHSRFLEADRNRLFVFIGQNARKDETQVIGLIQ